MTTTPVQKKYPRPERGRPAKDGKPRKTQTRRNKPAAKKKAAPAAGGSTRADAPAPVLSSAQRKHLRGVSHHLEPIVQVGHAGVTEQVVLAAKSALRDHELIKVRLHEPEDKKAMASELATQTASALCGLVGHTVILFKPHPDNPQLATQ